MSLIKEFNIKQVESKLEDLEKSIKRNITELNKYSKDTLEYSLMYCEIKGQMREREEYMTMLSISQQIKDKKAQYRELDIQYKNFLKTNAGTGNQSVCDIANSYIFQLGYIETEIASLEERLVLLCYESDIDLSI